MAFDISGASDWNLLMHEENMSKEDGDRFRKYLRRLGYEGSQEFAILKSLHTDWIDEGKP